MALSLTLISLKPQMWGGKYQKDPLLAEILFPDYSNITYKNNCNYNKILNFFFNLSESMHMLDMKGSTYFYQKEKQIKFQLIINFSIETIFCRF